MFTAGAFVMGGKIGRHAEESNIADRQQIAYLTDDEVKTAILHARQDLKLIAFLLYWILIGLGIVADLMVLGIIVGRIS